MNPLTLGVYAFHEQLRLLLREPPPGRTVVSIARVVIDGVDDKQLLQAIRLYETPTRICTRSRSTPSRSATSGASS